MIASEPACRDMTTVRANAIDAILARAVQRHDLPGVVAMVATTAGIRYSGSFGCSDVARQTAASADSLFFIASMTKAITSVAALQLVEQGLLQLDTPLENVLPELKKTMVLDGFDDQGRAVTRPPRQPMTLRQLLSHTAGFAYPHWNAKSKRYIDDHGLPDPLSCELASLDVPLVSDPGDAWNYGINLEFVGRAIERICGLSLDEYLRQKIFIPLEMEDTFYLVPEERRSAIAKIYARADDGELAEVPLALNDAPEFYPGGVGLYSTAGDYLTFIRMILHGGALNGHRLVGPDFIEMMGQDQTGSIPIGPMISQLPVWSRDVDFFSGQKKHWGLGFLVNAEPSAPVGARAA